MHPPPIPPQLSSVPSHLCRVSQADFQTPPPGDSATDSGVSGLGPVLWLWGSVNPPASSAVLDGTALIYRSLHHPRRGSLLKEAEEEAQSLRLNGPPVAPSRGQLSEQEQDVGKVSAQTLHPALC